MFDPHASERARLTRQAAAPPAPGTIAEAEALAAIDDARYAEEAETHGHLSRTRRRRLARHWSDRGAQLDGR